MGDMVEVDKAADGKSQKNEWARRGEGRQVDRVAKTIRRTFNGETLGCWCGLLTGDASIGFASPRRSPRKRKHYRE